MKVRKKLKSFSSNGRGIQDRKLSLLVFMLATGWSLGQAELLVTTLLTAARATTLQSTVVTARPRDAT